MFGAIRGVLYFPHYCYSPISLFSLIYSFLFPISYFLYISLAGLFSLLLWYGWFSFGFCWWPFWGGGGGSMMRILSKSYFRFCLSLFFLSFCPFFLFSFFTFLPFALLLIYIILARYIFYHCYTTARKDVFIYLFFFGGFVLINGWAGILNPQNTRNGDSGSQNVVPWHRFSGRRNSKLGPCKHASLKTTYVQPLL